MSTANQVLPEATVTENAPGIAFAPTGTPEVVVVAGPCSKGPYTPRRIGARNLSLLTSTFGCGPAVKEAAYGMGQVGSEFVFQRLLTASTPGVVHDVVATIGGSSTITHTTSGTITDGADVVITFTLGGTTGTGPINYTLSTDGGVHTSDPISLATGTTITVRGTVLALGSAKVATTGDTITWWQTPPSGALLTQTSTLAVGSTSTLSLAGAPEDQYQIAWQVVTGGTRGVAGIVYRYCMDYDGTDGTWTPDTALGVATSVLLLDGPVSTESSGITLSVAAGTLTAGDIIIANTSSPTYSGAGLTAAINGTTPVDGLVNFQGWTWIRACGPVTETIAATFDSLVLGLESAKRYTWGVCDARDRVAGESVATWEDRVASEFLPYTSTRVGVSGGMTRLVDPINGRHNRRPAMQACLPRAMAYTVQIDWAQYDKGPLPAGVSITDADNLLVEYNAFASNTLNAMGFITLRTWLGVSGVFPTKAALLGPDNDIKRVPLRRVMNVAKGLYDFVLRMPICKAFQVLKQDMPKWKLKAGDIYPPDLAAMNTQAKRVFDAGLTSQGFVSSYTFSFNPTPISLGGGSYRLKANLDLNALIYVDESDGDVQFVSATLSGDVGG